MSTIFTIKRELGSGPKITIIITKKDLETTVKNNSPRGRVEKFLHSAKRGPTFICVAWNRCIYTRSVMEFQFNKYNFDLTAIIHKVTKEDITYICNTCHSYLKKSHIPAQAVCNKLQIFETPAEIKNLNRLKHILIARRILFEKVTIMPKGQFQKLKGAICNTAIDTSAITNVLPHSPDSYSLIMVKPKHKLSFRGHVCFSPVSPGNKCDVSYKRIQTQN